jgi:hypothetical protein
MLKISFAHRYRFPHTYRGNGPAHDCGDLSYLCHQFIELIGEQ